MLMMYFPGKSISSICTTAGGTRADRTEDAGKAGAGKGPHPGGAPGRRRPLVHGTGQEDRRPAQRAWRRAGGLVSNSTPKNDKKIRTEFSDCSGTHQQRADSRPQSLPDSSGTHKQQHTPCTLYCNRVTCGWDKADSRRRPETRCAEGTHTTDAQPSTPQHLCCGFKRVLRPDRTPASASPARSQSGAAAASAPPAGRPAAAAADPHPPSCCSCTASGR